jgi:outer membrane protein TolC
MEFVTTLKRPWWVRSLTAGADKRIPTHPSEKIFQLLPSILVFLAGMAVADPPGEEGFLREVLVRNPAIQAESLTVAGSRETRSGANSLLLPQLNIAATGTSSTNFDGTSNYSGQGTGTLTQILPTGGTLEGDALVGRGHGQSPGESTGYDTAGVGISFTQPFLQGFGSGSPTLNTATQARLSERVQLHASRSTVLATIDEARTAWWMQRSLESVLAAHIQDTTRTWRLLVNARQNLASGAGSVLDTIQAFANHLQALSDWLTARTTARAGAVDLGAFLDSSEIWLGDPRSDTLAIEPPDSLLREWPPVDSLMRLAEDNAPDIAEALAQEEQAKATKIFLDNQILPTLDGGVFARKALLPGDATPRGVVGGVQVNFNWNIPDGVNRAAARKALLDLHKAGIQAVTAKNTLRRSLIKYLELSRQYALAISLQRHLIEADKLQLTADEQGYKDGSVAWADLTAARSSWLAAVGTVWNAVALAEANESNIESLTGTGPARLGWNWGE